MRTLILPSLTSPGHFLVTPDIDLDDALAYIDSFQARVIRNGAADRMAPMWCHMSRADDSETCYGGHVQALVDFPVDGFRPLDLRTAEDTDLTDLGRVGQPGLSGLRAVYLQTEGDRATLVLGTVVMFNSQRYTQGYRDNDLAEHVSAIRAEEKSQPAATGAPSPKDLRHLQQAQILSDISEALVAQAQVLHAPILGRMALQIREVVASLTGDEAPKPAAPERPAVGDTLDPVVQQMVDQGREVVHQVGEGLQRARNWLADQIDRRGR